MEAGADSVLQALSRGRRQGVHPRAIDGGLKIDDFAPRLSFFFVWA
jgi:methylmalonyl-CoA mutase N-terminal domain/subunit